MNTKFSEANWQRCISEQGFNTFPTPLYLATCIAAEAGEVAGIIQKLERGFNVREKKKTIKKLIRDWEKDNPGHPPLTTEGMSDEMLEDTWRKSLIRKLAPEIADVYSYLDLLCSRFNINMPKSVIDKFNEVSEEMEYPERLELVPDSPKVATFPVDRNLKDLNQNLYNHYTNKSK